MIRLMEVTQFTSQDYDLFKMGTKFENPTKVKAMELVLQNEKDEKSELNIKFGGITNVRRVRVLRESEDQTPEMKSMTLNFELKNQVRDLEREKAKEKMKEDGQRNRNKLIEYPIWVPNMKFLAAEALREAINELSKEKDQELAEKLIAIRIKVEEIADSKLIVDCRAEVTNIVELIDQSRSDGWDGRKVFVSLDTAQSVLGVMQRVGVMFDKGQFIAHAKKLMGPKTFHKPNSGKGNNSSRPPHPPA